MKKAVLTAIIMLTGASAMAQYYPGPVPPPVYYPPQGGGGYHHHRQPDPNDQASAMSAATGAMFLSLASICASGPGCYYRAMDTAKEEAVMKKVDGTTGPVVERALELLGQQKEFRSATEEQKLDAIINFQAPAKAAQ
jgi:hypothetical protein